MRDFSNKLLVYLGIPLICKEVASLKSISRGFVYGKPIQLKREQKINFIKRALIFQDKPKSYLPYIIPCEGELV